MTKVIKSRGYCGNGDALFFIDTDVADEMLKNTISEIADTFNGFQITIHFKHITYKYIGFVFGDVWRIAYFHNGIARGHFEGENGVEMFLDEICRYNLYNDLYIKTA
jgi:hypothetical protein